MGDAPIQPPPMSRGRRLSYSIGGPILLMALLFVPAGSLAWVNGWIFLAVFVAATLVSMVVLRRVNPLIFRAPAGSCGIRIDRPGHTNRTGG